MAVDDWDSSCSVSLLTPRYFLKSAFVRPISGQCQNIGDTLKNGIVRLFFRKLLFQYCSIRRMHLKWKAGFLGWTSFICWSLRR